MNQDLLAIVSHYGLAVVFGNVLLEQLGVPLPAVPILVVAGAMAVNGKLSLFAVVTVAIIACVIADGTWYLAGRYFGNRVMKTLCRISLTPDSCVSETQSRFERWGINALVIAKFVPGLSLIAPPLAGATGVGWVRYLLFNTMGTALWVGAAVGGGVLLGPQIDRLLAYANRFGTIAIIVLGLLLATYIAFKWWERRSFYAMLRMARISVDELYRLMDAGRAPVIVDVRTQTARALQPRRIPGALHVTLQSIAEHIKDLPRDRDIILYCTCPNEASAAQAAKLLFDAGFMRVRPLLGGLDAWIAAGHPVESIAIEVGRLIEALPGSIDQR
ncbi:MAG TPA: DedA family protein/thiosulfate sulfurtransferase GlpE [Casimicrobiaceae bacterium]|jgi:membrane protein DedA with SNARE-associated domain/rhodanese-related sulfurtransferase|nr:DedA family protein/thiosulfate sulfurtransferase GlpE [Casimicrobiaceae bacterium]